MRLPIAAVLLIGICGPVRAGDLSSGPLVTISGVNNLRFADGNDISNPQSAMPWKYLLNSTDVRVGIGGFYLKTRFDVEEPSLGYNPPEPVYREYFSRRTLGFESDPFFIEAGHITTQFGRGLTLSLKEDRDIERYTLLDGVYGQLRYSWMTLQAVVGRPISLLSQPLDLFYTKGQDTNTIHVTDETDLRFRDIVIGGFGEIFLPTEKAPFSIFSSGSIGGGIVRYDTAVSEFKKLPSHPGNQSSDENFFYRNDSAMYLPSAFLNVTRGAFGLSVEQAWMRGVWHGYGESADSPGEVTAFEKRESTPVGSSTYLSMQAQIFGVSVLAEYKNYYYDKSHPLFNGVYAFLVPPAARYQHSWHLLNKHLFPNLMGDAVGYNLMINWAPSPTAAVVADFNSGGQHNGRKSYWEAYGEWMKDLGDRCHLKIGFDYGKLEPDLDSAIFRTLAADIEAGPFWKCHSFGLILESQLNDIVIPVEKPNEQTSYRQYAFNLLATVSYHFVPWFTLALTFEHERPLFDRQFVNDESEIESISIDYASVGFSLKPTSGSTITAEYGSMSGGKICTMGTCVDLPAFKGFKLTVTSML